jgi:23S rRNA pseudouridine2605 synthase
MPEERLQKILAKAGVASRRKSEELILAGRVSVNGKTVTELGSKADLSIDKVKVDGRVLSEPKHYLYFAFNKPKSVVSTVHDPEGRQTVLSFFKGLHDRLYPIGRLDYASEGLLLLTNDGEFANKMMSPANHVTKTYLVKANGPLLPDQEEQFRHGIPIHGRKTAPAGLKLIRKGINPWYEVKLIEGRQNQIRIMFKHFGRLVEKLKRVKIAFLDLGALKPGAYRTLTNAEVAHFRRLLHLDDGIEKEEEDAIQHDRPRDDRAVSQRQDHRRGRSFKQSHAS